MTTSMGGLRVFSKELIESIRHLDAMIDEVSQLGHEASQDAVVRLAGIAAEARRTLSKLVDTRAKLLSFADTGLKAGGEIQVIKRGVAASLAAIPLGPGCQAVEEFMTLAERDRPSGRLPTREVLMAPLYIAYRQCIEALSPLASPMDPREQV